MANINTDSKKWQKGAAGWVLPLIIVILALAGIIYLANKSKPELGTEADILSVKEDDWIIGDRNAKVILIEYGDFQCPACGAYFPLLASMKQKYSPTDMAIVYRHFPLAGHKNAYPAALAAQAAGAQGKFFQMHDKLFSTQSSWESANNASELFVSFAQEIGLDVEKFKTDVASEQTRMRVEEDKLEGVKIGVNSTPTFYVNGKKLTANPKSLEAFQAIIDEAIKTGNTSTSTSTPAYHAHVDIGLVLNGSAFDFSKPEFQSTKEKELSEDVHVHNDNGEVVHFHDEHETIAGFLRSLGFLIDETKNCLTTPDKKSYCNNESKFVIVKNGEVQLNGKNHIGLSFLNSPSSDLDRVYIEYASGKEDLAAIIERSKMMSDDACIYSEKCPERGTPPKEECVGGLGTACTD